MKFFRCDKLVRFCGKNTLVDDELNILNAFKRRLAGTYEILTAANATDALTILQDNGGSVSIIVSDMYMPGMQGNEFLKEVARKYPETVRVMLTGLADQKTAIKAIHDGSVFRFLNKPCSMEQFEQVLSDSVAHRKLIQQEKDLLQNTLGGVISLISDLLSFIDPDGMQSARLTRKILKDILKALSISSLEAELAVMLSNLGKFSLPLELLMKISKGQLLNPQEESMLTQVIPTTARLLKQIPRLDKVAILLENVNAVQLPNDNFQKSIVLSIRISKKAADISFDNEDTFVVLERILKDLPDDEKIFLQKLLTKKFDQTKKESSTETTSYSINVLQLCAGQRLMVDVKDKTGQLLLKKGFMISQALIERIKNHHMLVGVQEPIYVDVRIPTI